MNLSTFSDSQLKDMTFQYDPDIWEVKIMTSTAQDPSNTGVSLQEKKTGGKLMFSYTLAYGMGGGYGAFYQKDLTNLSGDLARIAIGDKFQYGLQNEIVLFNESPSELAQAKETCQESAKPDYDGMEMFSKEVCSEIESGQIVGYSKEPSFTRSIRLKRIASLGKINPDWADDEYIKNANLDDGYIIVAITYEGVDPSNADQIVEQIVE